MTLWQRLQSIGILQRDQQTDVTSEAVRFKSDPAFQQYMAEAQFNIIQQLHSLQEHEVEEFQALKRSQMALEGLENYIEQVIITSKMKTADRSRSIL